MSWKFHTRQKNGKTKADNSIFPLFILPWQIKWYCIVEYIDRVVYIDSAGTKFLMKAELNLPDKWKILSDVGRAFCTVISSLPLCLELEETIFKC